MNLRSLVGKARPVWPAVVLACAVCLPCGCNWNGPGGADASRFSVDRNDDEFQAGAKRPPTARTLYAMARILAAQGKDVECEFVLGRVIREHPGFLPAYCEMAELRVRQRRIEEAVATLDAARIISPNDPIILNNLGMCMLLKSEYDDALTLFTQASSVIPQEARYRANMAVALGMIGRYDESLALYEQVVPPAEAHFNLGVLCEARKDLTRAAKEFRRAKELGLTDTGRKMTDSTAPGNKPR